MNSNCLVKPVTEIKHKIYPEIAIFDGCLIITVTENEAKLWSITITGRTVLDLKSKEALFCQLALRYNWSESKKERMDMLSEIEEIILPRLGIKSMHRKSLIRKLRRAMLPDDKAPKRGRKPKYNDLDKHHLLQIWKLSGYPCSKRLKSILSEWLEYYDCADLIKSHLKQMSPSRMDEYLRESRLYHRKKINSGTHPAKQHIRKLIRLRDASIRHDEPGFTETDTVLHCGNYIWGSFAHTVSLTDLYSGWTSGRSTFGKNAILVVTALKDIRAQLPFEMKSLFFDNGIEFINHLLVDEFKVNECIDVARGRSGRSNDQCHIEQKNNTFVRGVFDYQRIESKELVDLMNDIYENTWELLHNYFMPQMKLVSKDRRGAKVYKKYDKPKTPYQRIIDCPKVSEEVKESLRMAKIELNPFELQASLQKKLADFNQRLDEYNKNKELSS